MKIIKTIILSIVLALVSSKIRRGRDSGKKCFSHAGCKETEYCANMEKKHGQMTGGCEKKHDKNQFCYEEVMCKKGLICENRVCKE